MKFLESVGHKRVLFATWAGAIVLSGTWTPTVSAEPYLALREGFPCAACHINRTGGGMRNVMLDTRPGAVLKLPNDGQGVLGDTSQRFSPQLNTYLRVGADFRIVDELLFQDDPDENGRVRNNTAFREVESNDIDVAQGTLYGELRLIPGYLSLYIDERIAPGSATNREAWAVLDNVLPNGIYLKAGRFFPAWGLKIQDDSAFVNRASGFSFTRTLSGVEVGRVADGINWVVSVSDAAEGTADDVDVLITGSAYHLWTDVGPFTTIMAGASLAHDVPADNDFNGYTAFGGFSCGRFSVLTHAVLLDRKTGPESVQSWAWGFYTEGNYLLRDWINAKIAFDYLDGDDNVPDDATNRVSIGIEPFLDRFLQLRLFYRVLNGPKDDLGANRDILTLEAHLFF